MKNDAKNGYVYNDYKHVFNDDVFNEGPSSETGGFEYSSEASKKESSMDYGDFEDGQKERENYEMTSPADAKMEREVLARIEAGSGYKLGSLDEYYTDSGMDALLITLAWNVRENINLTPAQMDFLIRNSAPTQVADDGNNALILAFCNNKNERLGLDLEQLGLLILNSDLKVVSKEGDTALLSALSFNRSSALGLGVDEFDCLIAGSDLNACVSTGRWSKMTPVMMAFEVNKANGLNLTRGQFEALIKGSDLTMRAKDGRDALMFALDNNKGQGLGFDKAVFDALIEGSDLSVVAKDGRSALMRALENRVEQGLDFDGEMVSRMVSRSSLTQVSSDGTGVLGLLATALESGLSGVAVGAEKTAELAEAVLENRSPRELAVAIGLGLGQSGLDAVAMGALRAGDFSEGFAEALAAAGATFAGLDAKLAGAMGKRLSPTAVETVVGAFLRKNPDRFDLDGKLPKESVSPETLAFLVDAGGGGRIPDLLGALNAKRGKAGLVAALERAGLGEISDLMGFDDAMASGSHLAAEKILVSKPGVAKALNRLDRGAWLARKAVEHTDAGLFAALVSSGVSMGEELAANGAELLSVALSKRDARLTGLLLDAGASSHGAAVGRSLSPRLFGSLMKMGSDALGLVGRLEEAGVFPDVSDLLDMPSNPQDVFDELAARAAKRVLGRGANELADKAALAEGIATGRLLHGVCSEVSAKARRGIVELACEQGGADVVSGMARELLSEDKAAFSYSDFGGVDFSALEVDDGSRSALANLMRGAALAGGSAWDFADAMERTMGAAVEGDLARAAVRKNSKSALDALFAAGGISRLEEMTQEALARKVPVETAAVLLAAGADPWGVLGRLAKSGVVWAQKTGIADDGLAPILALGVLYGGDCGVDDAKARVAGRNPGLLAFAPRSAVSDKAVVMAAVTIDAQALAYASPTLRADFEVALAACRNDAKVAFPLLHKDLVRKLGLAPENCKAELEAAVSPPMFGFMKKAALARAREELDRIVDLEERALTSRMRVPLEVSTALLESSADDAGLNKAERVALEGVVARAKGLNDGVGVEVSDGDAAEFKKILERNLPTVLQRYSTIPPSERGIAGEDRSTTPREDFMSSMESTMGLLGLMEKRAVDFAKGGVAMEAAVLARGLPKFAAAVERADGAQWELSKEPSSGDNEGNGLEEPKQLFSGLKRGV